MKIIYIKLRNACSFADIRDKKDVHCTLLLNLHGLSENDRFNSTETQECAVEHGKSQKDIFEKKGKCSMISDDH